MPTVAGWIDDLRAAFGAETINAAIRAGMTASHLLRRRKRPRCGHEIAGQGVTLAET